MGSSWWRPRRPQPPMLQIIQCVLQIMLLPVVSRGCFPEERAALMEIRASLLRANSTVPSPLQWGNDDCCSWERVTCDNTTRRVSHLDLSAVYGVPASGTWTLDSTIFAVFPELQFLDLSSNNAITVSLNGFKSLSNLRELHLSSNNISGNFPSFLFSLPHIQVLDISFNRFEGRIPINPSSILSRSLTTLQLSYNSLSGPFSFSLLSNLSNLVEMDLSGNANLGVDVNIPAGWVPPFQLKHLLLSGCDLDKGILANPNFLCTQTHLEELDLSHNNLSESVLPDCLFRKGTTLVNLNLQNTSLSGSLPPIWYPQATVQSIVIAENRMVGQLPANISSIFPSLIRLDVSRNNFYGEIPMSLCHINHIRILELHTNNFSGEMPACLFTDLPNLWILGAGINHLGGPILCGRNNLSIGFALHLGGNKFHGPLPRNLSGELSVMELHDNKLTGELDASSWNLPSLQVLDVAGNDMTGEIHAQICDLLPNIEFLELSNNHFTGPIMKGSCNSTSLLSLSASTNLFSGDVLWENYSTPNLFYLDIKHNMLTGDLSWVHRFPWMSVLSLGHNEFYGHIPPILCELRYLMIIDLSHNELSGSMPPCLGALPFYFDDTSPFFQRILFLSSNAWREEGRFIFDTKGVQLMYGGKIVTMSGIDLSANSLVGEIPWELGNLSHVKSLNLSSNALTGPIPTNLSNMIELESLDLSHNQLTGVMPMELTRLRSLEVFSVAYNHLSGCVPSSNQFGTFGANSYEGNNQLKMDCSIPPSVGPVAPRDDKMVVDAGPYAVGATSFVLSFWSTVAFLLFHSIGRQLLVRLIRL